jgi:Trehalose-phosphatase
LQALTRVQPALFNSVRALANEPNTTVVIFSGSDKSKLEDTFGNLNVWLAAENGIFMRPPAYDDSEEAVGGWVGGWVGGDRTAGVRVVGWAVDWKGSDGMRGLLARQ